jgi:hypothetical protein
MFPSVDKAVIRRFIFKLICLSASLIIIIQNIVSLFVYLEKIEKPFNGSYIKHEYPKLSFKDILDGSFQNQFEKWFNERLPLRLTMTYIYNQILYTIFDSTDTYIQIGKENYLIEPTYPQSYLMEYDDNTSDLLKNKINILFSLQKELKTHNKEFLVIITPSKASIYPDKLPLAYMPYVSMKMNGEYLPNGHEIFVNYANELGLNYFDRHDMFEKLRKGNIDVFVKGGAHWTGQAVVPYFNELSSVISKMLKKHVGIVQIESENKRLGIPFNEDDDLVNLLNLYKPDYNFISNHITTSIIDSGGYYPSIFLVGGSFNWKLLYLNYGFDAWNNKWGGGGG